MTNLEALAKDLLKTINEIINEFDEAFRDVGEYDKQTNDILHKLELDELNYKERCKLMTQLKDIRVERRKRKDITENYYSLYNLLKQNANRSVKDTLINFSKELQRHITLKQNLNNRNYVYRSKKFQEEE